ncbi:TIGR04463 family radical SAM/SPASM RiPP maturase [Sorangium sp. So ce1153]|uniref:TIGR04463 family radical SAM/SPASM RiPP maturase n=1 Tax=Sorangium sp. So ce1153 TaxID=3133333 RepID=UPI003F64189C
MIQRRTSRYTILIPLHRYRALAYNGMSGAFAVWEAEELAAYERIRDGDRQDAISPAVVSALEHGGFILRDDIDELSVLKTQYDAHRYRKDVLTLTVAPTLACNFGCDYCFQGQDKPTETMSAEVQDAIVALVQRAAPRMKVMGIAWYGGEPLLRRKVIESLSDRVIEVADRHRVKYEASIVTNGYLLNAEAARSLSARRVRQAQVTLDGGEAHHDARRYLLSRKGTFARIVDNLREVVEAAPGLQIAVRVNIDDRNRDDIRGLLESMAAAGLGGRKNLKVYFAPVEAITEGCHEIEESCLSKSAYGRLEADLYRHGFELGLTQLPYPPRFHGTCAAVRPGGFVVLPNGDLHKCWDTVSWPERRVGTIFNLEALPANEALLRWMRWTPFVNETCKNCKLLPNCAGACAYKFVHADLTRGEAAVLPCPSWKYNIKERLLNRALAVGAVTADDFDPGAVRTDPAELCADTALAGEALPPEMQAFYDAHAQKAASKKRKLPLLQGERAL